LYIILLKRNPFILFMTHILVMGAGTVGARDADLLKSLGYDVSLVKATFDYHEPRTRDLLRIYEKHNQGFPFYIVGDKDLMDLPGLDAIDRNYGFRLEDINPQRLEDLDWSGVDLVIDATDKDRITRANIERFYSPHNVPFVVNGGAPADVVDRRFFAGIPGTALQRNGSLDAKIVSSNTHCVSTLLSLGYQLAEELGMVDQSKTGIVAANVIYLRRHADPDTKDNRPNSVSIVPKPYHVGEVEALLPLAKGRLKTFVGKVPAEYFHTVLMNLQFERGYRSSFQFVESLRERVKAYPWAVLSEAGVDHEKVIQAAANVGIEDGDIPFPVYHLQAGEKGQLTVLGLTPQRGIVVPSTAVYAEMRTKGSSLQKAFDFVNNNGRYRGQLLHSLASRLEEEIARL
jgi:glyceraldehyde-3-phosphate dehydrogenase/erythrose-4-phosphate dehydrogenase